MKCCSWCRMPAVINGNCLEHYVEGRPVIPVAWEGRGYGAFSQVYERPVAVVRKWLRGRQEVARVS